MDANPLSKKDGWQQSATLHTGDPVGNLTMQANFPRAGYYTVQFGILPPNDLVNNNFDNRFDAIATIEWSVEGQTIRRVVSVGNGVSVSGPGQAVRVVVNDVTPLAAPPDGLLPYVVTVQVTPGQRPSLERPPTLIGIRSQHLMAPLGTFSLLVPANSGVISVQVVAAALVAGTPSPPDLNVEHRTPAVISKTYNQNFDTRFVALAPNATSIRILNLSALNSYNVGITWGIDG